MFQSICLGLSLIVIWAEFEHLHSEDETCALGEGLFSIDGHPECDCYEVEYEYYFLSKVFLDDFQGWLRHEGRCYQEFTPAFCGDNKILNLGTRKRLRNGQKHTCVKNPCGNMLPHR